MVNPNVHFVPSMLACLETFPNFACKHDWLPCGLLCIFKSVSVLACWTGITFSSHFGWTSPYVFSLLEGDDLDNLLPLAALVSRQFVDMSRIRIEGLLAAFPKLIGTGGKQHTYVETENVRYVYQPIEALYLLVVTNKQSNILEDLETLRMLSKLVSFIVLFIVTTV